MIWLSVIGVSVIRENLRNPSSSFFVRENSQKERQINGRQIVGREWLSGANPARQSTNGGT